MVRRGVTAGPAAPPAWMFQQFPHPNGAALQAAGNRSDNGSSKLWWLFRVDVEDAAWPLDDPVDSLLAGLFPQFAWMISPSTK